METKKAMNPRKNFMENKNTATFKITVIRL